MAKMGTNWQKLTEISKKKPKKTKYQQKQAKMGTNWQKQEDHN